MQYHRDHQDGTDDWVGALTPLFPNSPNSGTADIHLRRYAWARATTPATSCQIGFCNRLRTKLRVRGIA